MKIIDDRDWGDGEFSFWFSLICYEMSTPCLHATSPVGYDVYPEKFNASSGETRTFDRVLPDEPPTMPDYDSSVEGGYPLRQGHNYHLLFGMEEQDKFSNYEQMGRVRLVLTPENGWGIGTHTIRSSRNDDRTGDGAGDGDYELTFEVRKLVAPDLRPVDVKVLDLPGSTKKRVCTAVQNVEAGLAGQFDVLLRVDDQVLTDGRGSAPGLAPGSATEVCAEAELPTSGTFKLAAIVDPVNTLIEYSEANNVHEITHTVPPQPAAPSKPTTSSNPSASTLPAPEQSTSQADLTVSAIQVNGQVPDGKNDCKDGKNTVSVVVKNASTSKAGDFVVRLVVDDSPGASLEQGVDHLEAGKEVQLTFGSMRLKKGPHSLTAIADATTGINESDEGNNTLTVTVSCKDDA